MLISAGMHDGSLSSLPCVVWQQDFRFSSRIRWMVRVPTGYCRLPPQVPSRGQGDRQRGSEGRRRGRAHGIYDDPSISRWGWGAHHQWRCIGGQKARIWSSRLPRRVRPRRRPTSLAWCFVSAPARASARGRGLRAGWPPVLCRAPRSRGGRGERPGGSRAPSGRAVLCVRRPPSGPLPCAARRADEGRAGGASAAPRLHQRRAGRRPTGCRRAPCAEQIPDRDERAESADEGRRGREARRRRCAAAAYGHRAAGLG